jgi:xylulokinase
VSHINRKSRFLPLELCDAMEGRDAKYLGFDSSTQSLKVIALDSKLRTVAFESVQFDSALPHYKTTDGVHRHGEGRITGPVLIWVEALELALSNLQKKQVDFSKILAISRSGQQHGSVFWKEGGNQLLQDSDPSKSLLTQLQDAFTVLASPVWMDSSTTRQCREIEQALGGPAAVCELTGSRAHERFTGPQIRKFYQTQVCSHSNPHFVCDCTGQLSRKHRLIIPTCTDSAVAQEEVYKRTERISLVSSFMASLLVGKYASIDQADGAGMNLMDLRSRTWSPEAFKATAPGLEEKLGPLAPSHSVAGKLHSYFVEK